MTKTRRPHKRVKDKASLKVVFLRESRKPILRVRGVKEKKKWKPLLGMIRNTSYLLVKQDAHPSPTNHRPDGESDFTVLFLIHGACEDGKSGWTNLLTAPGCGACTIIGWIVDCLCHDYCIGYSIKWFKIAVHRFTRWVPFEESPEAYKAAFVTGAVIVAD